MGKKGDKKRARKKRGRMRTAPKRLDAHVRVTLESLASAGALLREVTLATDPVAEVEERIASVVEELSGAFVGIEPAGTSTSTRAPAVESPGARAHPPPSQHESVVR